MGVREPLLLGLLVSALSANKKKVRQKPDLPCCYHHPQARIRQLSSGQNIVSFFLLSIEVCNSQLAEVVGVAFILAALSASVAGWGIALVVRACSYHSLAPQCG